MVLEPFTKHPELQVKSPTPSFFFSWDPALLLLDNTMDGSQVVLGGTSPGGSQSHLVSALKHRQSFCRDSEGWGPFGPTGFHLTPCFQDAVIAAIAVWGTLAGAGALWMLLNKRIPQPVAKNWHFYLKLVCRFSAQMFGTSWSTNPR